MSRPGRRKASEDLSPEDREQIRENLVRMELFAQAAEKGGLPGIPKSRRPRDLATQLIQQASAQNTLKDHIPTETELRAEYETQLATMPLIELRARHIVVSGEDVAQKVIERLKGGADFASLAKQMSDPQGIRRNGGELGWFSPNAMGPEFGNAVSLLKKGEITAAQCRRVWAGTWYSSKDPRSCHAAFEQVQEQVESWC